MEEEIFYYTCGFCGYCHFSDSPLYFFHRMFGGKAGVLVMQEIGPQRVRIDSQKPGKKAEGDWLAKRKIA